MVTLLAPEGLAEWIEIEATEDSIKLTVSENAPPGTEGKLEQWLKDMEEAMQIGE